jgi:hypothetical protein
MATSTIRARTRIADYAWTVFAGFGALLLLSGFGGLFGHDSYPSGWHWSQGTSLYRENALNELLMGFFGVAIAVFGLRPGERWAWFAMLPWPAWIVAQNWRDWTFSGVEWEGGSIFDSFLAIAVGRCL